MFYILLHFSIKPENGVLVAKHFKQNIIVQQM